MIKMTGVKALAGHRIECTFANGKTVIYDMSYVLTKSTPMLDPLKDWVLQTRFYRSGRAGLAERLRSLSRPHLAASARVHRGTLAALDAKRFVNPDEAAVQICFKLRGVELSQENYFNEVATHALGEARDATPCFYDTSTNTLRAIRSN